jgi:hypothetical protein
MAFLDGPHPGLHNLYVNVSGPQKPVAGVYVILPELTTAVPPLSVGDWTLHIVAPLLFSSLASTSMTTGLPCKVVAASSNGTGHVCASVQFKSRIRMNSTV